MWFTIKYRSAEEIAEDLDRVEVIVTVWGEDEQALRTGGSLRSLADIVAFLRFAIGPQSTAPRCGLCGAPVDVPDLDAIAEAA